MVTDDDVKRLAAHSAVMEAQLSVYKRYHDSMMKLFFNEDLTLKMITDIPGKEGMEVPLISVIELPKMLSIENIKLDTSCEEIEFLKLMLSAALGAMKECDCDKYFSELMQEIENKIAIKKEATD